MIRAFTKDDWATFGGIKEFPCGASPIIEDQLSDLTFAASESGIEVLEPRDDEQWHSYKLEVADMTLQMGYFLLRNLPRDVEHLVGLGFKKLV